MTDIQKLRDDVVEAAKRDNSQRGGKPGAYTAALELDRAIGALLAAEEAERKPRLRSHGEVADAIAREFLHHDDMTQWFDTRCVRETVRIRDAEWTAVLQSRAVNYQLRKGDGQSGDLWSGMIVMLSDIEALAAEAKR